VHAPIDAAQTFSRQRNYSLNAPQLPPFLDHIGGQTARLVNGTGRASSAAGHVLGTEKEDSASNGLKNRIYRARGRVGPSTASWNFSRVRVRPSIQLKGTERTCSWWGAQNSRNLPGEAHQAHRKTQQLPQLASRKPPAASSGWVRPEVTQAFKGCAATASRLARGVAPCSWAKGARRPAINRVGEGHPGQQTTATKGRACRIKGTAQPRAPIASGFQCSGLAWFRLLCSWFPARRPGSAASPVCGAPEGPGSAIARQR